MPCQSATSTLKIVFKVNKGTILQMWQTGMITRSAINSQRLNKWGGVLILWSFGVECNFSKPQGGYCNLPFIFWDCINFLDLFLTSEKFYFYLWLLSLSFILFFWQVTQFDTIRQETGYHIRKKQKILTVRVCARVYNLGGGQNVWAPLSSCTTAGVSI